MTTTTQNNQPLPVSPRMGCREQNSRKAAKRDRCFALPLWQGLLILALVFCADGVWIQAKAWLAQYLIAGAWAQSLDQDQPIKPWPWADTWPVARLQMPQQDVDLFVLDGSHGSALAFGPGRLHGTVNPGAPGLSIVGGHRDTHFRFLQYVKSGDVLTVTSAQGDHRQYQVEYTQVVNSQETPLLASADQDRLLLITCYPFDAIQPGGDLRYVVSARPLVNSVSG